MPGDSSKRGEIHKRKTAENSKFGNSHLILVLQNEVTVPEFLHLIH